MLSLSSCTKDCQNRVVIHPEKALLLQDSSKAQLKLHQLLRNFSLEIKKEAQIKYLNNMQSNDLQLLNSILLKHTCCEEKFSPKRASSTLIENALKKS
jgi:hypothetical protein